MNGGRSWPSRLPCRTSLSRLLAALAILFATGPSAFAQLVELPRPDSSAGDYFGTSVAIDGDRILVGATGVDTCGPNSGAAYVYDRIPGSEKWRLSARLTASDCEEGTFFGRSVDLDGRFAVVAASREFFSQERPNAVYVFELDSLSNAGQERDSLSTILDERAWSSTSWKEVARLTGRSEAKEGAFATSISIDGERILVTTSGDPSSGRFGGTAHVFDRDPGSGEWRRSAVLTGSAGVDVGIFGTAGALGGRIAAVAASTYVRERPGSVYIFERDGDAWREAARFGEVQDFFISVDVDGHRVLAGESRAMRNESGSATLFERRADGRWEASHVFRPSKPYDKGAFGSIVVLEGEYALFVGYDEQLNLDFNIDRVVFVFRKDQSSGSWRQLQVIDIGTVDFGSDLDVSGRFAVIGAASASEPGSAYVVRLGGCGGADLPGVPLDALIDEAFARDPETGSLYVLDRLNEPLRNTALPVKNVHVPGQTDSLRTYFFDGLALTVYEVDGGKEILRQIITSEERYSTRDGIRVGMSARDLESILGEPMERKGDALVFDLGGEMPTLLFAEITDDVVRRLEWRFPLD